MRGDRATGGKRIVAALLVAFLIAGLVGGGYVLFFSGGVSKDDFIEQADGICREIGEEAAAIEFGDPTDLSATGDFYQSNLELLEDQTARLKALDPPEEDREVLDDWFNTQEQLALAFEEAVAAAQAGDQGGFDAALGDMALIQARSTEIASRYGFSRCGIASPE